MKNLAPLWHVALVTYVIAVGCAGVQKETGQVTQQSSTPPTGVTNQVLPSKDTVELEASFEIPQAEVGTVSHTPAVVFTPDGKRMLTATSSSEITVFEVPSRNLLERIRFPGAGTSRVGIDPSGRYAVWALKEGGVAVMDLESQEIVSRDPKLEANSVAASPGGGTLVLSRKHEVEIREVETLSLIRSLEGHSGEVTNLAWSQDGKLLASTAKDGRLIVHQVANGRKVIELKKDTPLYAVDFNPKRALIAYGGHDKVVYQYDFEEERESVISKGKPYWITCLGYSPDGELIAVGDESCDIWLYRVRTKDLSFHNKHHVECWLSSVAWAPDNETFLFGCRPNDHEGAPTLHAPLVLAEAAQSQGVQHSRDALVRAIDDHLHQVKDKKERKVLANYKMALALDPHYEQGQIQDFPGVDINLASASTASSAGVLEFTGMETWRQLIAKRKPKGIAELEEDPDVAPLVPVTILPKLPPYLQRLAKEHAEALRKEVLRLQKSFQVNQWKVRR